MKSLMLIILALSAFLIIGCDNDTEYITEVVYIGEEGPPPVPQGVYSVTGDGEVLLYWLPIDDVAGDFDAYVIYRSDTDPDTGYVEIGETTNEYFVDDDVTNGNTYFYAVSSVDEDGYLSDLSYEYVFDTPRPEGINRTVFDFNTMPLYSGWDFSAVVSVPYTSPNADIYLEFYADHGVFYINVADENTDIQDMGYTGDLDEIGYAPDDGWSYLGWSEVILGHTYIIWTSDNHFAKLRVTAINNDNVLFDWAYQVDTGNPELKPLITKPERPRPDNYLRTPERNNKFRDINKIALKGNKTSSLDNSVKEGI
ncbi:MAG: hypothetical protein ABIE07_12830 [Candidatus Zixiibacteriota bacterium]